MSEKKRLAKITSKGQITIPQEFRNMYDFAEGTYVVCEATEDYLVIRKAAINATRDFDEFAEPIRRRFQQEGIQPNDIEEAIQWARTQK
jgi:AbrB family looped-hinge helix DNA binding protein